MTSEEFLAKVKRGEADRIEAEIALHLATGMRDAPHVNVFTSAELDRSQADRTEGLTTVSTLSHTSTVEDSARLRPFYEAQRARRDININRASRTRRILSGLNELRWHGMELDGELKRNTDGRLA